MMGSLHRILVIARNTLTEAVRQKVLSVLLLFGIVMICTSSFFSQVVIDQQIKFVKDFGCGAIGLIGLFIAILSTAQLLPQELHNRTIYTILAKPVRRAEFLFGKFLGVVLLLALSVLLMALAFAATLWWQESAGLASTHAIYARAPNWDSSPEVVNQYHRDMDAIISQARDPQLIEAILLIFAKLVMAAAIALVISTFSTSFVFTVICTALLYLVGHMESTAREVWLQRGAEASFWQNSLLEILSLLVPDMNSFTIVDEILAGNRVPWWHTLNLLGYAGVYVLILLALSELIFRHREI
jgi:ABC-type transport system involved in multi-copper enzyme maturation permease subunit